MHFLKYFIKKRVFAGGGWGGVECSIFTPDMVWGRGSGHGSGGGSTQTRPVVMPR